MKTVRILILSFLFCLPLVFTTVETDAQCAMCRMSAESNLGAGGTDGRGLNRGILYMLMMPYVLVGTIGYVWWRNQRREEEVEPDY